MAGIHRILIDQQLAELGVNVTPAKMRINTPRMQMRIRSEIPQMEIERQAPRFRVNRKKINSESGLKSPMDFTHAFRDEGRAAALRGAGTAKDDGNFLGEIRRRGDKVGQLARSKAMSAVMRKQQINIGLMPKSSPEVEWDEGYLQINWSKHSLVIDWDGEFMPQLTIDPKYSLEIYLRTEPYFRIVIEEVTDPNMPGRLVDQAI